MCFCAFQQIRHSTQITFPTHSFHLLPNLRYLSTIHAGHTCLYVCVCVCMRFYRYWIVEMKNDKNFQRELPRLSSIIFSRSIRTYRESGRYRAPARLLLSLFCFLCFLSPVILSYTLNFFIRRFVSEPSTLIGCSNVAGDGAWVTFRTFGSVATERYIIFTQSQYMIYVCVWRGDGRGCVCGRICESEWAIGRVRQWCENVRLSAVGNFLWTVRYFGISISFVYPMQCHVIWMLV